MPERATLRFLPVYCDLMDSGFNSAVLEKALAGLSRESDRAAVIRDLLAAFAEEPPQLSLEGMELISAFASLLLLLGDRPIVLEALRNALEPGPSLEQASMGALMALQEWLGEAMETIAPPREIVSRLGSALLDAARQGPNAEVYLAIALGTLPSPTRIPVADWLLDHLSSRERRLFGALALMAPVGTALRVHLARGFAHGGPEAQELLERLSEEELSASEREAARRPTLAEHVRSLKRPPLSDLPFDWPAEEAWVTPPDASGVQGLILVRRQAPGRFALFSTVLTPILGFVQSFGAPGLTRADVNGMLDEMRDSGMLLVSMPPEYVLTRIRDGMRRAQERGLPLSFDFQAWRYLLAGLWSLPAIDIAAQVKAWADPSRLAETDLILGDEMIEGMALANDGTRGTEPFFAESGPLLDTAREVEPKPRKVKAADLDPMLGEILALPFSAAVLKKLDAVIDRHVEAIATLDERRFWRDLLVQYAYLYANFDLTGLRTLCATAAWALDPVSGIPIAEQPFWRELLRQSAFEDHLKRYAESLDEAPRPSRSLPPGVQVQATPAHMPKISEALIRFAEPLVSQIPGKPSAQQLEQMLDRLVMFWNLLVLEEIGGKDAPTAKAPIPPDLRGVYEMLRAHKRKVAPDDRRIIQSVEVIMRSDGGFDVRATSSDAPSGEQIVRATASKAFQLKISLKGSKPPIWRRVVVSADATLANLHGIIQAVMGWQDYHLHAFTLGHLVFSAKGMLEEAQDEREITLAAAFEEGDALLYEYDFGDGWQLSVKLEKDIVTMPKRSLPSVTGGKRAAPPEDIGGLYGYYSWLEALADPEHPDHEEAQEVLGEDFDPERIDLEALNDALIFV